MSEVRIAAEVRTEFGKGAARRTRRAGKVPAVLYGHGADTRHLSLPGHDLMLALKGGANTLLELQLDGGTELALPREVTRDPIKGFLEHLDLLLVRRGEKVTVDVMVLVTGEAVPDSLVDQQATTVSVEAEATAIPGSFEVSVQGMGIGAAVHARDVRLPAGVTLRGEPDTVVVHVMAAPTAEQVEAELAEAEAEVGAGAVAAAAEAEAKAGVEGEASTEEPTGEGDIVPDTDSGEGGPGEGQTPRS